MDPVFVLILLGLPLIPTFWAILDIPRRQFSHRRKKILWFLAVSSLPVVGALLYLVFARRHTTPLRHS